MVNLKGFAFKKYLSPKRQLFVFAMLISIALVLSISLGFEFHFSRTSREVVESWYANEYTSIQQGNVLSSVTKLQRTLNSSSLLNGVLVVDEVDRVLVSFGKTQFVRDLVVGDGSKITEFSIGIFKKAFAFRVKGLRVFIFAESKIITFFIFLISFYVLSVVFGFGILIRNVSFKEQKLKTEFEVGQLNLELKYNERIALLSRRVAHDIRSPLSALNVISKTVKSALPQEGVVLDEVTSRIISIANELLDESRRSDVPKNGTDVEGVHTESEGRPIVPFVPYENILKDCALLIEEKKLTLGAREVGLRLYQEGDLGFQVFCDRTQLIRIVSNLLNNSIEAIDGAGFISITLSNGSGELLIEVRDSGGGMPEEIISEAFKRPVSVGKVGGNGLGLHPAIEAIKSWGGRVNICSTPNRGTTVSVFLPMC